MSNKSSKKKKETKGNFWVKLIWRGFIVGWLAFFGLLIIIAYTDLPPLEQLENPKFNEATEVISGDGKVLGTYFIENRTNAAYHELSPHLVNALVATEDERFFDHSGVDSWAIIRAIAKLGQAGGGSTISQQLAKMLFHKREKNFFKAVKQKLGEWIIATRIEKNYTKEEIITMYFNQFDWTRQAVGINSASRVYFNKTPNQLKIEEAAMLVGMAKSPHYYNPISKPERALNRRNTVLGQMKRNEFITQVEFDSLTKLPLETDYTSASHKEGIATYFRAYLKKEVVNLLNEKDASGNYKFYNKKEDRPYNIYKDGLKIYTTVDSRMQTYAEKAINRHLGRDLQKKLDGFMNKRNGFYSKNPPFANTASTKTTQNIINRAKRQTPLFKKLTGSMCNTCERPKTHEETIDGVVQFVCDFDEKHIYPKPTPAQIDKEFNTPVKTKVFTWDNKKFEKDTTMSPLEVIKYHKRFLRSSLLSMDPRNGHVKAWVGGPNYKYFQYDMVATGKRQVGSTMKPFVYGTAISEGVINPCTMAPDIVYCIDVPYNDQRTTQWCPDKKQAMDGLLVSMKYALAKSKNNITAHVIDKTKPSNVIANLERAGIPNGVVKTVPSMALGVFDLSLYDMVGAVSSFANNGVYTKPTAIVSIEDKEGNIIYTSEPEISQVFDPHTAYTMLQMMKGVVDGVSHPSKPGDIGQTSQRLRRNNPYGNIPYPIAGKTGTTNDNVDGWFLGLTPELVTGVWAGGEDRQVRFQSTRYGQGANMALPSWGYYMNSIYKDKSIKISKGDFEVPNNHVDIYTNCDGQANENN